MRDFLFIVAVGFIAAGIGLICYAIPSYILGLFVAVSVFCGLLKLAEKVGWA